MLFRSRDRIRLLDEKPKEKVTIKSTQNRVSFKDQSDVIKVGKTVSSRVQDSEDKRQKQTSSKTSHKKVKVH